MTNSQDTFLAPLGCWRCGKQPEISRDGGISLWHTCYAGAAPNEAKRAIHSVTRPAASMQEAVNDWNFMQAAKLPVDDIGTERDGNGGKMPGQ